MLKLGIKQGSKGRFANGLECWSKHKRVLVWEEIPKRLNARWGSLGRQRFSLWASLGRCLSWESSKEAQFDYVCIVRWRWIIHEWLKNKSDMSDIALLRSKTSSSSVAHWTQQFVFMSYFWELLKLITRQGGIVTFYELPLAYRLAGSQARRLRSFLWAALGRCLRWKPGTRQRGKGWFADGSACSCKQKRVDANVNTKEC